jgi:hypothetical protein
MLYGQISYCYQPFDVYSLSLFFHHLHLLPPTYSLTGTRIEKLSWEQKPDLIGFTKTRENQPEIEVTADGLTRGRGNCSFKSIGGVG